MLWKSNGKIEQTVIYPGQVSVKATIHRSLRKIKYGKIISTVNSFRSVVVITSASHAEGPGFEPQRKHFLTSTQKAALALWYESDAKITSLLVIKWLYLTYNSIYSKANSFALKNSYVFTKNNPSSHGQFQKVQSGGPIYIPRTIDDCWTSAQHGVRNL